MMIRKTNRKMRVVAVGAALLLTQAGIVGGATNAAADGGHTVPISSIPHDRDYLPLTSIRPHYPRSAAENNISGFVIIEMTVSNDGTVAADSIKIIESSPEGVFEKSAVDTVKRFRYSPTMHNGKATAVSGVRYKFSFSTEK